MTKELTERLRGAVQQLRRTPMPIADVAPMLNQAADTIERLQLDLATFKHGHRIASERCAELERELAESRNDPVKTIQGLIDSHKRDTNGECDDHCDIVVGMEAARDAVAASQPQG